MLPLALQGEDAARIDNVSELFAFQDRTRQGGAPGGAAGAGTTTPDPGADPSAHTEEPGEDESDPPRA